MIWTEESIRELLYTNDKAVLRALVALWEYQTNSEQVIGEAVEQNSVGYNKPDSKTAKFYIGLIQSNQKLHQGQIAKLRNMLFKYAGQLTKIANLNEMVKNGR